MRTSSRCTCSPDRGAGAACAASQASATLLPQTSCTGNLSGLEARRRPLTTRRLSPAVPGLLPGVLRRPDLAHAKVRLLAEHHVDLERWGRPFGTILPKDLVDLVVLLARQRRRRVADEDGHGPNLTDPTRTAPAPATWTDVGRGPPTFRRRSRRSFGITSATAGSPAARSPLRQVASVVALTATSALVLAGSASAASQTVQGSGDIDKMTVNNAGSALKVNLFGFGPPCEAHYMKVVVDWGMKAGYQLENGCYPGATGPRPSRTCPTGRSRRARRSSPAPRSGSSFSATAGSHRAVVPRSCIPRPATGSRCAPPGTATAR